MKLTGSDRLIDKIIFRLKYAYKNRSNNIFTLFDNWYFYFLDYIPFLNKLLLEYRLKSGEKFLIRNNTYDLTILNEILIYQQYGNPKELTEENAVVIDIGAHIGIFSVFAARISKNISVYSFEPVSENYSILKKNVAINNLDNQIKCFNLGITKKGGKRYLYFDKKNTGGHSLFRSSADKVLINTIKLEEVFRINEIRYCNLLKIDTEGAEYEIIPNLSKMYLKRIKNIVIEYHNNGEVGSLVEILNKNGFSVVKGGENFQLLFATRF